MKDDYYIDDNVKRDDVANPPSQFFKFCEALAGMDIYNKTNMYHKYKYEIYHSSNSPLVAAKQLLENKHPVFYIEPKKRKYSN